MRDERFEELMADARRTYNLPAEPPPFDEMWDEIEFARTAAATVPQRRRPALWLNTWLRMAAVLVVGIGLGRLSLPPGRPAAEPVAAAAAEAETGVPAEYRTQTDAYLGEAAALLIGLPRELSQSRIDSSYITRADDLLMQTRLLLDSPASSDESLRSLLEDLELVLVQLVRLQSGDQTKFDLLNDALQQSHVIPRLRDAVVDHIAD